MENPFKKLVSEEEPLAEEDKREELEDAKKRLDDLRMWQNSWTVEDRQLAEDLENDIERLKIEIGQ